MVCYHTCLQNGVGKLWSRFDFSALRRCAAYHLSISWRTKRSLQKLTRHCLEGAMWDSSCKYQGSNRGLKISSTPIDSIDQTWLDQELWGSWLDITGQVFEAGVTAGRWPIIVFFRAKSCGAHIAPQRNVARQDFLPWCQSVKHRSRSGSGFLSPACASGLFSTIFMEHSLKRCLFRCIYPPGASDWGSGLKRLVMSVPIPQWAIFLYKIWEPDLVEKTIWNIQRASFTTSNLGVKACWVPVFQTKLSPIHWYQISTEIQNPSIAFDLSLNF